MLIVAIFGTSSGLWGLDEDHGELLAKFAEKTKSVMQAELEPSVYYKAYEEDARKQVEEMYQNHLRKCPGDLLMEYLGLAHELYDIVKEHASGVDEYRKVKAEGKYFKWYSVEMFERLSEEAQKEELEDLYYRLSKYVAMVYLHSTVYDREDRAMLLEESFGS